LPGSLQKKIELWRSALITGEPANLVGITTWGVTVTNQRTKITPTRLKTRWGTAQPYVLVLLHLWPNSRHLERLTISSASLPSALTTLARPLLVMPIIFDSVKVRQSLRVGRRWRQKSRLQRYPSCLPWTKMPDGGSTTAYPTMRRQIHGALIPHK
jgi:hypothetical protein